MFKKILVPLYIAFIFYSVMSFFSGPLGVSSMEDLVNFKDDLALNISLMAMRSQTLEDEFSRLRSSREQVALHARSLGLYRSKENVILLNNYSYKKNSYAQDRQMFYTPFHERENSYYVEKALILFILLAACFFFIDGIRQFVSRFSESVIARHG